MTNNLKLCVAAMIICMASLTSCDYWKRIHLPPVVINPEDTIFRERDEWTMDDIIPDQVPEQDEEAEGKYMRRSMERSLASDTSTITLPVVFHIIHTGLTAQNNISDAQIQAGLKLVNEQFGNYGTKGWKGPVTQDGQIPIDSHIRFALAKVDPAGQPTSGIIRVDGRAVEGYEANGIRKAGSGVGAVELALKNLSNWPHDKYLNIYVVSEIAGNNAGTGVVAYAYLPPAIPTANDGVVIQYTAIGCKAFYPQSIMVDAWENTLTHELGHACGLYHTFNNTISCVVGSANCLTIGDKLCDTPPTTQSSSCTPPGTCPLAPVGNYMGYSAKTCQHVVTPGFTPDGVFRMRTQLLANRTALTNSNTWRDVTTLEAGISFSISGMTCKEVLAGVSVNVQNLGSEIIRSVVLNDISYDVNIPKGGSAAVSLPDIQLPVPCVFPYVVTLTKINGQVDQYAANNTAILGVQRVDGKEVRMNWVADFYPEEAGWTIKDSRGTVMAAKASYPAQYTIASNGAKTRKCGVEFNDTYCLPEGDYILVLTDSHDDAQSFTLCKSTVGFRLYDGAKVLTESKGCWCNQAATSNACKPCSTFTFPFSVR